MAEIVVCALYRFVALENYRQLKSPLLATMSAQGIKGTLLLAPEGINGTVAGKRAAIDHLLAWLRADPRLAGLSHKESLTDINPFYRTKVKLKREIVTMGVTGIDPNRVVGTYVKPRDWNALVLRDDVLLVDTRNDYEVQVGTFRGAINPHTESFREFPRYVAEHLDPAKHRKVAMFCTGGIRCEKSTAYLKQQGFDEVYHLEGGILQYLEDVPPEDSLWQGECFVFDNRVTVNHQLQPGSYDQCHGCRQPITAQDKASDKYQPGISCPHCHDRLTAEQQQRFAERQRQQSLARARGEEHIGAEAIDIARQRKQAKIRLKDRQRRADRVVNRRSTAR